MVMVPNPYPQEPWTEVADFAYLTPLVLRREVEALLLRPDGGIDAEYIVAEPYRVGFRLDGCDERQIEVPAGFLTDLVSAPTIAALAGIRRIGPYLEATIVHDYLYVAWQYLEDEADRKPRNENRRFADEVYRAAMIAAKVPGSQVRLIYHAVRAFGRSTYAAENPGSFGELPEQRPGIA